EFAKRVSEVLEAIQQNLFERAKKFREENIHEVKTWDEFRQTIENQGGFIRTGWCGSSECEAKIKEATKATVRCMPAQSDAAAVCVYCGKPSQHNPLFAQAY
ncbi:MAG: proline--tRNA ligase, partial [Dehalococcoidales bacterium]|nr:proline--tRNA ligase [Dehalococcoidales bacterium]